MSDQVFTNMKAVVSGATGTIGRAICQRIVEDGGSVVLLGRNEEMLKKAVVEMGSQASYAIVYIDDDDSVEAFARTLDRVDILVCTAGWTVIGPVDDVPVADAVDMFNARFFGQCRLIKSALPKFDNGGLIVMCSGVATDAYYPNYGFGTAVCSAIDAYAHHIAVELAPRKIRVNSISPGWTVPVEPNSNSAGPTRVFAPEKAMPAFNTALDSPLHETIPPEEFADALVFMTRAKHLTGEIVRLDAGRGLTDVPFDGFVEINR